MKDIDDRIVIAQRANGWVILIMDPDTDEVTELVATTPEDVAAIVAAELKIR